MTGREILESIRAEFKDGTRLVKSTGAEHLIRLPFVDQMGDPVEIGVSITKWEAVMDDAGAIGHHTHPDEGYRPLAQGGRRHPPGAHGPR